MGEEGRRLLDLALVAGAGVLAGLGLAAIGVPTPALFGGLLAGLVRALARRGTVVVPGVAATGGQAVIGVAMGSLVDLETLRTVAGNWLPVLLVTVGTLALSIGAGLLLGLQRGISPVTGAFSMIAGGAAGIIVMARDLGADDRMVAVLQYLRVLLIVVLVPAVAALAYGGSSGDGGPPAVAEEAGWPAGVLFTAGCAAAGLLVGRLVRLPVAALLGPMIAAAAVDLAGLAGLAGDLAVPGVLQSGAFLVIGLQVGVSFTRESLRMIGRALPPALALILGLVLASAGLGAVLSATTGAGPLDGYLATTPGGLYAVLATASDLGADVTFVLAVQVLRLFVMLLSAPLVARWLRRSAAG